MGALDPIPGYEGYQSVDNINFGKIYDNFRRLCLFDDHFLGMQAMNIGIVDPFITDLEHDLLREFIEIERTPMQQALFVSAQSQMWIFSVYELLRTWRERSRKLIKNKKSGGLQLFIKKHEDGDEINAAAAIQVHQAKRMLADKDFETTLNEHLQLMEPPFRCAEELRMILAKHEVAGHGTLIPLAPGYGRINMLCGSMDYQVHGRNGDTYLVNRRDLAELLRESSVDHLIQAD